MGAETFQHSLMLAWPLVSLSARLRAMQASAEDPCWTCTALWQLQPITKGKTRGKPAELMS